MISANSTWSFKRHRGSNPQSLAFGRLGFPSQRFEHLPHLRNPGADATNVTLRFLLLDLEQLHWLLVALQIILDVTNRPFRSQAGDDRLLGQILRNLGFGSLISTSFMRMSNVMCLHTGRVMSTSMLRCRFFSQGVTHSMSFLWPSDPRSHFPSSRSCLADQHIPVKHLTAGGCLVRHAPQWRLKRLTSFGMFSRQT